MDCELPLDTPLIEGLILSVDCNIEGLVRTGYSALADPAGPIGLTLTAALTLFIAFFGWRLMLGRASINVGDATVAALKIGVVLLLATSWETYQLLVYDVLTDGPRELAAALGAGESVERLQAAFDGLQDSSEYYGQRVGAVSPFIGGMAFGAMALNATSVLLLLSTIGLLLAAKIVLALLLALAPVLAGLLLFDATRGMIEGWARAMIALAFVPLAVTLLLAIELTMLEPGLATIAAFRGDGRFELAPVLSLATLALIFAAVIGLACLSGVAIARGLRFPRRTGGLGSTESAPAATNLADNTVTYQTNTRTARVAAALESAARRTAPGMRLSAAADVSAPVLVSGLSVSRGSSREAIASDLAAMSGRPGRRRSTLGAMRRAR